MARTTPIRNAGQGDYRLREECSTDTARVGDAPVEYRLAGVSGHPIERVGNGWRAVDRTPGAPMAPDELDEMRAVMVGADPRTGERLIRAPKTAVAAAAKLPARPLLEKLLREKRRVPAGSWAHKRLGRLARGVDKDREHTAPVKDLKRIAKVAGVDPATVWGRELLDHAEAHKDDRDEARVRGWDLTLDSPKSVSVLYALGDARTAAAVEQAYLAAARETVATVEEWVSQGQRGEHGRGKTARRIKTAGVLGTLTLHTSARPVGGEADPHLHAHVMIANMSRGEDGVWSGIAAGGRELYLATPAAGELMRANLRARLARDLGVRWVEEAPGRWEIQGIGPEVRDLYSRRRDQALQRAGDGATPAQRRLAARRTATAKLGGQAAENRRTAWAGRARAAGHDPDQLVARALGRRTPDPENTPDPARVERLQERRADMAAARLWRAAPTRGVSHARMLGAAAATAETGMTPTEAEQLARAIASRGTPTGTARGAHLRHATRTAPPQVSEADARAGRGPTARAASHRVKALRARQAVVEQQLTAARAALVALEAPARSGPTAWRSGTTRRTAAQQLQAVTDQAREAQQSLDRITTQIRKLREQAVKSDRSIARAQRRAREALQAVQAEARRRAAIRAVALPVQPRPAAPRRGPRGTAVPPAAPTAFPRYRPRPGPERGGPGLGR